MAILEWAAFAAQALGVVVLVAGMRRARLPLTPRRDRLFPD